MSGVRPDPPLYEIELARQASTLRILLRGDFDLESRPELERVLLGLDPAGLERVVIDLRQVTFFDSTGLNMAFRLDVWGRDNGIPILFTRAAPNVMRGLVAAGLAHTVTFSDAPEDQLTQRPTEQ